MREPSAGNPIFGLMAEFDAPEHLHESVERARAAGFQNIDACSPFPIEGLAALVGFRERRVPALVLAGGIFGAIFGYGLQVYTNLAFPIDIGGRPLLAPPAFLLITFELTVLFAVLFGIGGMLALNHLPRLNHPFFDSEAFARASCDRFFLVIFSNDPQFDEAKTARFLAGLSPLRVELLSRTEEPE